MATLENIFDHTRASNIMDDETDEALDHLLTTGLVIEVTTIASFSFRLDGSPEQSQPRTISIARPVLTMGLYGRFSGGAWRGLEQHR